MFCLFEYLHKLNVTQIASPGRFPVERDLCFVVISGVSYAPYFAYCRATSTRLRVGIGRTEGSIGGSVSTVQGIVCSCSLNEETAEIIAGVCP